MDKNSYSHSLSMGIVKKIANRKVILPVVIVGAAALFLVTIFTLSPLGHLSAQQMAMNGNISKYDNVPKLNGSINDGPGNKEFL